MLAEELDRLAALHRDGQLNDEEFQRAKARVLEGQAAPVPATPAPSPLRRSRTDRWLGGVCAGLARAMGLESWMLRLLFVGLVLLGGFGVLAYVLLWIFMPGE